MTRIYGYTLDPESGAPQPGLRVGCVLFPVTRPALQGPVSTGTDDVVSDDAARWELNLLPTAGSGRVVRIQSIGLFIIYADIPAAITGGVGDLTAIDVTTLLVDPTTLDPITDDPSVYLPRALLGQPNGVASLGPDGILTPAQRPAGPVSIVLTAATVLSGHRMVTKQGDGTATYADWTTVAAEPLWMTLAAASSGAPVSVQAAGVIDEPSWTFTPGPVYLGATGLLTQTVPTVGAGAGFLVQVGFATSGTSIVLDRYPSIRLI